MHILVVTQYFYPERFVINELAEDLLRFGHDVTVLTGMPNYPGGKLFPGYRRPWPRREMHNGIQIVRLPIVPRGDGSRWRLAINYFSYVVSGCLLGPFLLRGPIDLIFVFEISPVTVGIPAIVVKAIKRAPIFFWILDLWPESLAAVEAIGNPRMLRLIRRVVRFIYRHSNVILISSRAFAPKVREVLPEAPDVRYFPNPADRLYQPVAPPPDAPEHRLLRPGFRIMFAGNMGAAQDLGTILAAAELLKHRPEIQWILIGDGRLRPWVEEEIRTRRLESVVQILGPYPPERMPSFFALADVLLATLRNSEIFSLTMPLKIQTYLACGRPILLAIDGEATRVIAEAGAGLSCAASDPHGLADKAIRFFEASQAERDAMGLAGRRYFEREFDRDLLVGRLSEWFQLATVRK